jgi:hypothetical protein
MIEILEQEGSFLYLKAEGKLTHADYEKVLIPTLEQVIRKEGKARVLFIMGKEFQGWEAAAAWDDARFGIKHRNDFEKCAVVGGPKWVEWATKLAALIMPGEVRVYEADALEQARIWIKAPLSSRQAGI